MLCLLLLFLNAYNNYSQIQRKFKMESDSDSSVDGGDCKLYCPPSDWSNSSVREQMYVDAATLLRQQRTRTMLANLLRTLLNNPLNKPSLYDVLGKPRPSVIGILISTL